NHAEKSDPVCSASCVVPRLAPEAAVKSNVACVASRVFVKPSMVTVNPEALRAQVTDEIPGAARATVIRCGVTPAAVTLWPEMVVKVRVMVMTPATVPVFTTTVGDCAG